VAERRALRRDGVDRLRRAGVDVSDSEVDQLLSAALGDVGRSALVLVAELTDEQAAHFEDLLARREQREPLQHILGTAHFRYDALEVGPGVFVPRPETELLAGWAIEQALRLPAPVVVDLCTGSGAIARSVTREAPHAAVHAVELDEAAFGWAARNLAGTGVDRRQGDMATAFDDLAGRVDIVVCNPPYIPLEAWESVAVEARDHDPHLALFSGDDGLDAMRVLERRAATLLRPGGGVGAEHADAQGESAPAVFRDAGRWVDVVDHPDLAGRPRYVTARLAE
jgi:release factor glutamine methyltransferase